MKRLGIELVAIGMIIIFLGHVTGMRVSEYNCLDCGIKHVETGNPLQALHMIFSPNHNHPQCCDPFHEQHEEHSNTCFHSFLSHTAPFKVMEKTGQNLQNPLAFLIRELSPLRVSSENPGFLNILIFIKPVSGSILLKTCQSLT